MKDLDILKSAKNHAKELKKLWIKHAKELAQIKENRLYEKLGYTSFEEYYLKDLGYKKPTIDKLQADYKFLFRESPTAVEDDDPPSQKTVQQVRKAAKKKENEEIEPEDYQKIKDNGLKKKQSGETLRKQLTEAEINKKAVKKEKEEDLPAQIMALSGELDSFIKKLSLVGDELAEEHYLNLEEASNAIKTIAVGKLLDKSGGFALPSEEQEEPPPVTNTHKEESEPKEKEEETAQPTPTTGVTQIEKDLATATRILNEEGHGARTIEYFHSALENAEVKTIPQEILNRLEEEGIISQDFDGDTNYLSFPANFQGHEEEGFSISPEEEESQDLYEELDPSQMEELL